MIPAPLNPSEAGFTQPDEQLAYLHGALLGKTVAEFYIGALMAQEHYDARHHPLTNLPNRRALDERLAELSSTEQIEDYALLYADGDNFKAINDIISHDRGDVVMVETGDALLRAIRTHEEGKDELYHMSGDEFVALLYTGPHDNKNENATPTEQQTVIEQVDMVRQRVNSQMIGVLEQNSDVQVLGYGVSVGIAFPSQGSSFESLKAAAETEMKEAKKRKTYVHRPATNDQEPSLAKDRERRKSMVRDVYSQAVTPPDGHQLDTSL